MGKKATTKESEVELRESEERFRFLVETTGDALYRLRYDSMKYDYMSPGIQALTGYDPSEIDEITFKGLVKKIEKSGARKVSSKELIEKRLSGNVEEFHADYLIERKDGDQKWLSDHSFPWRDKNGTIIGSVGILSDITKRKQMEKALMESEERYRALFENNPIETITVDHEARVTGYNMAKEKGGSRLPKVGDVMYKDYASKHDIDMHAELMEAIQTGATKKFPEQKYDDTFLHICISPYSEGAIITAIDITEQKRAEKEKLELRKKLERSRKMEALGLLASGVAHDLNNILSGIVSYPELLLMDLPKDDKMRKHIEIIYEAGQRASAVVSDLLTVSRGIATSMETIGINAIITDYMHSSEYEELMSRYSNVNVKTVFEDDLPNISCSQIHIQKSLMNLVSNAFEAIDGEGNVTISTRNRYVDSPLKGYADVRAGQYVVLAVSDDGPGISKDDLERVFEPFYTKKVMGRSGTGLGLAIVWNMIQDHNGYVDVRSTNEGTTFELYFPSTKEEVHKRKQSAKLEDILGNGETVLVVDDEEYQRIIASKMLGRLGYIVNTVESGELAVEYVKDHPVDLIVLDMLMEPGINGRETYEQILKMYPKQKAIIASGFSETQDVKDAQKLGAGAYIKKPYSLEKIGRAIKEELQKQ
jgi:PAS domain S-box-containing protein